MTKKFRWFPSNSIGLPYILEMGFVKAKAEKIPDSKASNELEIATPILKAFLRNPSHPVTNVFQFHKASPIDWRDKQIELVPEVHLDQVNPETEELFEILEENLRNLLAYLVKIQKADLQWNAHQSQAKAIWNN